MQCRLFLTPAEGADPVSRERECRQLRSELLNIDVEAVDFGEARQEAGAKGDAVTLTELIVTMSASGGLLPLVMATAQEWIKRRTQSHKLTISINGSSLELETASRRDIDRLVNAFMENQDEDRNVE
ncbi:effector-associated constant component EACC1 [Actinomycetospora termitidis]|uniref:effector-associated constant component EACC1 n=1 Tax=Actinomycetospora termitidis TaxID=3053470 RepID=UPI003CE5AC27